MKKLLLLCAVLCYALPVTAQTTNPETTLIMVRHAEKMDDGTSDPSLNADGKERAQRLAELLLNDFKISAIYSTPYKRTQETATPLADSLNIEIQEYGLSDPKGLIQTIITNNKGGTVLIAGHSNTTPLLVNIALGEEKYEQLDEKAYGNIFVVSIDEEGNARVDKRIY